jgi:hypothetical protein
MVADGQQDDGTVVKVDEKRRGEKRRERGRRGREEINTLRET